MKIFNIILPVTLTLVIIFLLTTKTSTPTFSGAGTVEITPLPIDTATQSKVDALTIDVAEDPNAPLVNLLLTFTDETGVVYRNSMMDLDAKITNLHGDVILKDKERVYYEALKAKAYEEFSARGLKDFATTTP